jgi:hypothetical protein
MRSVVNSLKSGMHFSNVELDSIKQASNILVERVFAKSKHSLGVAYTQVGSFIHTKASGLILPKRDCIDVLSMNRGNVYYRSYNNHKISQVNVGGAWMNHDPVVYRGLSGALTDWIERPLLVKDAIGSLLKKEAEQLIQKGEGIQAEAKGFQGPKSNSESGIILAGVGLGFLGAYALTQNSEKELVEVKEEAPVQLAPVVAPSAELEGLPATQYSDYVKAAGKVVAFIAVNAAFVLISSR